MNHMQRGPRCWSEGALLGGGGSGISRQLQPGDRGEAEGGPGEGAQHPCPRDTLLPLWALPRPLGRPSWPDPGVRWLWQVEPLLGLAKAALLHPRPQRLGLRRALGLAGDPWGEGESLTGSLGMPASPPVSLCTCA